MNNLFVLLTILHIFLFGCAYHHTSNRCSWRTTKVEAEITNNRFWFERLKVDDGSNIDIKSLASDLNSTISRRGIAPDKLESALIFVPRINALIPIRDGMLQPQHTTVLGDEAGNEDEIILCGFSPRAAHNIVSPDAEERPMIEERRVALNTALVVFGIDREELLDDKMAGKPPIRIYRSFTNPRPQAKENQLESLERMANRTAAQIHMALRQTRADDAAYYLRNTDRAISFERQLYPIVLVLDNIRSAFNVGSLFRTAETGGVSEIVTVGITAHPPHPKLRKTAFSSVDIVASRHFYDIMEAIEDLRSKGYIIVVLETTSRSVCYTDIEYKGKKIALVVGNEITGVDTRAMESAEYIAEIPTFGVKNSLNVAAAAPVVVFEVLRQMTAK